MATVSSIKVNALAQTLTRFKILSFVGIRTQKTY